MKAHDSPLAILATHDPSSREQHCCSSALAIAPVVPATQIHPGPEYPLEKRPKARVDFLSIRSIGYECPSGFVGKLGGMPLIIIKGSLGSINMLLAI